MSDHQTLSAKNFKIYRMYFASGTLIGVLCLIYLLTIPADPKNAWFLGFSASRLAMTVFFLLGILGFVIPWLRLKELAKLNRASTLRSLLNEKPFILHIIAGASLTGLISGICIFLVMPSLVNLSIHAILVRLLPLIVWMMLLSLQTLFAIDKLSDNFWFVIRKGFETVSLLFVPVLLFFIFLIAKSEPDFYFDLAREDNFFEWVTVIFLMGACILCLNMVVKISPKYYAWFYVAFALFCAFSSLEEVSWGQRILDIQSSEFFLENSDQLETNAHNVFQKWTGIRTTDVASLVLGFYGVVLPLMVLHPWVKTMVAKFKIPVPPIFLSLNFLIASILLTGNFTGREEEVGEMLFALCLFLFMMAEVINSFQMSANSDH